MYNLHRQQFRIFHEHYSITIFFYFNFYIRKIEIYNTGFDRNNLKKLLLQHYLEFIK